MTYCVGLKIDAGLVFISDTRTNAGVDNISTYRKMHVWEQPGERVIVLMSAGNLATTQAVVSLLDERTKAVSERTHTLLETPSMFQTARLVGNTVKEVILSSSPTGQKADLFQRLLHTWRPDQRLGTKAFPDLPGRQFYRIDR
jgi:putative proteasome-type protease